MTVFILYRFLWGQQIHRYVTHETGTIGSMKKFRDDKWAGLGGFEEAFEFGVFFDEFAHIVLFGVRQKRKEKGVTLL